MTPGAGGLAFVDPVGGAAGDMLLAALVDAGAPQRSVLEAVESVLPGRFRLHFEMVSRAGLRAMALRVEDGPGVHAPFPGHAGRRIEDLMAPVEAAALPSAVRIAALSVLARLGDAEAVSHGVPAGDVLLHELGDDDTLLDVVGVLAALHALGLLHEDGTADVEVGPMPVATGGTVASGHGLLPTPPPVTMELLRGFHLRPGGQGEWVTPTAAALLSAVGRPATSPPAMTLQVVGVGGGTRDDPGWPNVVRVWVGTRALPERVEPDPDRDAPTVRDLVVLEANLDDLSPELVADAAEALRAAGALDAWVTPVQMKKGRPGVVLAALCEPTSQATVEAAYFRATSTFGVRATVVRRAELDRRVVRVELPDAGGGVRVKVGLLGGRVVSAKPEHDDVAELAARVGLPVRVVHEEAVSVARRLRYDPVGEELG